MDFKMYINQLRIIGFAMVLGTAIMGSILVFLSSSFEFNNGDNLFYIACIIVISTQIFRYTLLRNFLKKAQLETDNRIKLEKYRNYTIIHYALVEGSALICLILAFISQNGLLFLLYFFLLLILISIIPSRNKVFRELDLKAKDLEEIL